MTKSLQAVVAVLVGATAASLAHAQSPSESFASTFAAMQALSSNSSNWQPDTRRLGNGPLNPPAALALRDLQALASDSPIWQLDQAKVPLDRGPTFAQANPHGLPFAQYQAYASNSNEYAVSPGTAMSAAMPMLANASRQSRDAGINAGNRR